MKLSLSTFLAALPALAALLPAHAASPTRAEVQHLLRRFAFSAPPETITAVMQSGIAPWLAAQENPNSLDDTGTQLEPLPTTLNPNGSFIDYNVFERVVMQHLVLTPRQLQAKMELHWLDHFAVGQGKVGDPAVMYHYDQTLRTLGLGNFTTLMIAVAREPAMLEWLDNNWNVGPVANENFARESMQLYTMGTTKLNEDGSPVLGADGTPLPNYNQSDVQEIAKAMTGYGVVFDNNDTNPQTRFSTQYFPGNHYTGQIKFFGSIRNVPTDGTAIDYVIRIMARRPSVAVYQVRELLQRFVTETPSPHYISDIVAVWRAQQNAPDQIAQVITAIVNHPEFDTAYHAMPKQPMELVVGVLRQMPGQMQGTVNVSPGGSLLWELSSLGQQLFYPESVFSFYRPGGLLSLTNTGSVLARTGVFSGISGSDPTNPYTDTYIDMPTLRARIGDTRMEPIRDYLLDAFVDGGSPSLQHIIGDFLGKTPSDHQIQGAMWLLLNTPDYTVN
jgi:uncharacterized protein (DUF1800 family)